MANVTFVAAIAQGYPKALGQCDLAIDTDQQQGIKVRGQTAEGKVSANGTSWNLQLGSVDYREILCKDTRVVVVCERCQFDITRQKMSFY